MDKSDFYFEKESYICFTFECVPDGTATDDVTDGCVLYTFLILFNS